MKILITGINGFIGKSVGSFLAEQHAVFGISRAQHESVATIIPLDLCNTNAVDSFIASDDSGNEMDVVLHLASKMASTESVEDISIIEHNLQITRNTLSLAKHFKAKHFINFSSTSVYPNIDGVFDENSVINPAPNSDCLYGLSKYNSEVLIDFFLRNTEVKITHLRCGMVFSDTMEVSRIYPMIKSDLQAKGEVDLFGNGERTINYLFIEELLTYLQTVIEKQIDGVYNVIKYSETLLELTHRICEKENIQNPTINLVAKGNAYKFVVDSSKLKNKMSGL